MLVFDMILLVVLILLMIGLGIRIALPQLLDSMREWPTLLLILAGEYLLMPLLTWGVIEAVGAEGPAAAAIALVMLGPGTEAAAAAVYLARANLPLAVTGIILTNILSPLAAPLLTAVVVPTPEAPETAAALHAVQTVGADVANVTLVAFLAVILPLAVGMALRPVSGGLIDATRTAFRVFIWLSLGLTVIYSIFLQSTLAPVVELAPALPALAGVVVATVIAVVLVFAAGQAMRIRPENAVSAAFVVGLQPVALGLYVALHRAADWPELTDLSVGYAMVLPFLIAATILLAGRPLRLPGQR